MATTKITTHPANAVARLPSQFKGKTNVEALVTDTVTPATSVEDALWELFTERGIDVAVGAQLDVLGRIVGQPRNGETDAVYRQRMRARIAANRSHGNAEDLINVMSLATNNALGKYIVNTPGGVAHVICRVGEIAITEAEAALIASMLFDAKSAGVKLNFQSNVSAEENTFETQDFFTRIDDGPYAAAETELRVAESFDFATWPNGAGSALLNQGTATQELITYSGTSNAGGFFVFSDVKNELGGDGLRFAHVDQEPVVFVTPEWTVNARDAVVWENKVNVTATGNDLEKTSGGAAFDAGATSVGSIAAGADGAVEFQINVVGDQLACGLSVGNTDENFTDIDFAIRQQSATALRIYESGVLPYIHAVGMVTGDVARVQRIGTEITYWLNGAKIYTSTLSSTGELLVDSSIFGVGDKILDAFIETITENTAEVQGFAGQTYKVFWENITKAEVIVNDITKITTTGVWDGGASSIVKSGLDCAAEWKLSAAGAGVIGGLGEADVSASNTDIEYGMTTRFGTDVRVTESGAFVFTHGTIVPAADDVLRVVRIGTEITYWYNGEKIYTSGITDAGNDLYFDSSLFNIGDQIIDAKFIAMEDDGEPEQDGGTLSSRRDGE